MQVNTQVQGGGGGSIGKHLLPASSPSPRFPVSRRTDQRPSATRATEDEAVQVVSCCHLSEVVLNSEIVLVCSFVTRHQKRTSWQQRIKERYTACSYKPLIPILSRSNSTFNVETAPVVDRHEIAVKKSQLRIRS